MTPPPPSGLARICARVLPIYGVVALWLAVSSAHLAWLRADTAPPSWDPAVHLTWSLVYTQLLAESEPVEGLLGVAAVSDYYPPLVHLAGSAMFALHGVVPPASSGFDTADIATLANLVFLLVLLLSAYALANRCYGPLAGLLAAFLVAVYPILAGQCHSFLLDLPLAALVAWFCALLAASRGLTHRWLGWPLGLVAGLGMLAKWSFAVLAAPALLATLVDARRLVRAKEAKLIAPVYSLLAGGVVCLVAAGPWYLSHPGAIVAEILTSNQTWRIDSDPGAFSLAGLAYYPAAVLSSQLFVPFTLLAAFGAAVAWRRRAELAGFGLLAAWFVGGLAALWLVPNKDPRFSMPLLPALAVLSAAWLAPRREPGRLRPVLQGTGLAATLAYGIVVFWGVAFGLGIPRLGPPAAPVYAEAAHFTTHPSRLRWPLEELARQIVRVTPPAGTCAVIPNTAHLNRLTVRYYVTRLTLPVVLDAAQRTVVLDAAADLPDTLEEWLARDYDTVVTMEGDQGAHTESIERLRGMIRQGWARFRECYEPVATLAMPGGEPVSLYRRRGRP